MNDLKKLAELKAAKTPEQTNIDFLIAREYAVRSDLSNALHRAAADLTADEKIDFCEHDAGGFVVRTLGVEEIAGEFFRARPEIKLEAIQRACSIHAIKKSKYGARAPITKQMKAIAKRLILIGDSERLPHYRSL